MGSSRDRLGHAHSNGVGWMHNPYEGEQVGNHYASRRREPEESSEDEAEDDEVRHCPLHLQFSCSSNPISPYMAQIQRISVAGGLLLGLHELGEMLYALSVGGAHASRLPCREV